jgi:hypothetical protein
VGLANYGSDVHRGACPAAWPAYLAGAPPTAPFYLPFRSLTHANASNLLVAGKLAAGSFFASAATRLHPAEWSSGVAAGGAAALMVRRGWDAAAALRHIDEVQAFLAGPAVDAPLEWAARDAART